MFTFVIDGGRKNNLCLREKQKFCKILFKKATNKQTKTKQKLKKMD